MITFGFFSEGRTDGAGVGRGTGWPALAGIWLNVSVFFLPTAFFAAGTLLATGCEAGATFFAMVAFAAAFTSGFATGLAGAFATGLAGAFTTAFFAAGFAAVVFFAAGVAFFDDAVFLTGAAFFATGLTFFLFTVF